MRKGDNGSRECAPDDRLGDEAIQICLVALDCFAALAMTASAGRCLHGFSGAENCSVRSRSDMSTTDSIGAVSSYT